MDLHILADRKSAGREAARLAATCLRQAVARDGHATIILATGTSQFDVLDALVRAQGIDWTRVSAFHLDEYLGLPAGHEGSFRHYLEQRFLQPLADKPAFFPINGEVDPVQEASRLSALIADRRIAVCLAGIGDNGHLAFNDPPADLVTQEPFIVVTLDETCRRQQWRQGWFASLEAVPRRAMTMSIRQMLKSDRIIVSAAGPHKAQAVRRTVEGPVTPLFPASILQTHRQTDLLLDQDSAALLSAAVR